MTIRTFGSMVVAAAVLVPTLALAQTAATPPQAESLNEEGKTFYKNKEYAKAVEKFQAAIALSPEARFYFNLCASDEKLGDYDAALQACDDVYTHQPTDELKGKTGERAADIRAKKKKRDAEVAANGGGNGTPTNGTGGNGTPTNGTGGNGTPTNGTGGNGGAVNAMPKPEPDEQIEAQVDPGVNYKWGFGVAIGPTFARSIGFDNIAHKNGFALHLDANYLIWPKKRWGVQAYLDVGAFGGAFNAIDSTNDSLSVVDIGVGVYHHMKLAPKFWLTFVGGAHLASLQPYTTSQGDSFGTAGVRLGANLDWILSQSSIVNVSLAYNFYLPAGGIVGGALPADYGFDKAGGYGALTIGYTYRTTKLLPGVVVLE